MTTVAVLPRDKFTPPPELSTFAVRQMHAGLLIPNRESIVSMTRELLKWRGEENPDLV